MNKLVSFFAVVLFFVPVTAQKKVIETPPFTVSNSKTLEISKVHLSEKETSLEVKAFFTPNYWIKIASDSYLKANGKKYKITGSEGITIDSLFYMPASGKASFTLKFEPLPKKTKSFDFIESDCPTCFKIYGIDLVNKKIKLPKLPKEYNQLSKTATDFKVDWKKGKTTLSGQIFAYRPELGEVFLEYINPITGKETKIPLAINADGLFSQSVEIYSPSSLFLTSKMFNFPIVMAPEKETKVIINLPEIQRFKTKLLANKAPYGKKIYFAGYLADVNTELIEILDETYLRKSHIDLDSIASLGNEAYLTHIKENYEQLIKRNNSLKISPITQKIVNTEALIDYYNDLDMANNMQARVYAKKHNIDLMEAFRKIKLESNKKQREEFYKMIPHNDTNILLAPSVNDLIEDLQQARTEGSKLVELATFLAENSKVAEKDRTLFKEYVSSQKQNKPFEKMQELGEVAPKYLELIQEYEKQNAGVFFLAKLWNTNDSFLLKLIKSQNLTLKLSDFKPFTEEDEKEIASLPAIMQESLLNENANLIAKIEENKKKTGFTVFDVPQTTDEELFIEMLKPFKGKVILVDIWATWCGPCRMANKEMEPLKAKFADKDVVFLYLAGEDSPQDTWQNMIPDLKGQHYRLNKNQWNYLRKTLNAKGVPTYIIINKEGNQSYHSVGFPGVGVIESEINKAIL